MTMRSLKVAALLAAATMWSMPAAEAQGFFQRLFVPQRHYYEYERYPEYQRRPAPRPQVRQQAPRPPAPKIKTVRGPSYYSYKVDALKPVAFTALAAAAAKAAEIAKGDVPEPFASADPADERFAEDIARLQGVEVLAEKEVAEALQRFYAEHRGFLWLEGDKPNKRAVTAIRTLGNAESYGLEAADYLVQLPDPAAGREGALRFEMALSARVLRYVNDAYNGRVVADRLSGYHDLPLKPLDRVAVLKSLADGRDAASHIESFHPASPQYRVLRTRLELLRASVEKEIVLPPDTLVKPGQTSEALPDILALIEKKADAAFREKHGAVLATYRNDTVYGPELVPVIKAAQQAHGLSTDGVVGRRTVAALAGESRASMITKVTLALERLRWLPHELGSTHVFINQPAFRVTYQADGVEKLNMRAVVGTKANQTSFFYDQVEQVDFNPYWGVPQSIIVNEMLPKLHRDPSYLDRAGYEVFASNGRQVASASVNWWQFNGKVPYDVRQKPGPDNALGELKILFPNKHAIYMHDTPQKHLFSRDMRAFSHGCVRLEDPRAMAEAVLGWSREQIAEKIARGHSIAKVTTKIPVYIAYFTAWPRANGEIGFYDDVYERDAHLLKAMEAVTTGRQAGA